MDEVDRCTICCEPFKVGHDSDGRHYYLDRVAMTDRDEPGKVKFLCHRECAEQPRIWKKLLELDRRLNAVEGQLEPNRGPGMTLQVLAAELRTVPWATLGVLLLSVLMTHQITKHYYARAWLRYAPEKARDVVLSAQRSAAEAERGRRAAEAENAELRGQIAAGRQALAEPRRLELVERRAAR